MKMLNSTILKLSQRKAFFIFSSCCIVSGWFHFIPLNLCIHVCKHGVCILFPPAIQAFLTHVSAVCALFCAYSELLKSTPYCVCVCVSWGWRLICKAPLYLLGNPIPRLAESVVLPLIATVWEGIIILFCLVSGGK